jgi:hypothetical protein
MPRSISTRTLAVLFLFLAATMGCSSGGSSSELAQVESDASEALQLLAALIDALDPFAAPAPPSVGLGDPKGCVDVSGGQCNEGGSVLQCETDGDEVEILFDACAFDQFGFVGGVDGLLTFDPMQDWPSGSRTVEFTSTDGMAQYAFTLNGTATVEIFIVDLDSASMYDCAGSLETFIADCQPVVREEV